MNAAHLAVVLASLAGLVGGGSSSQPAADRLRRFHPVAGLGAGRRPHAAALNHEREAGGHIDGRAARWSGRAAAAGALLLGLSGHGVGAVVAGVVATSLLAPAALARRELLGHQLALSRDVPRAADLLATCLDAGAAPAAALGVVAAVLEGPLAGVLGSAAAVLTLGGSIGSEAVRRAPSGNSNAARSAVSPSRDVPWSTLTRDSPAGALLAAFSRTTFTGAPLSATLRDLAADERDRARGLSLERARKAGVHAIGPLAVCFLPAFVLVGVVPVVVGVASSLLAGWA